MHKITIDGLDWASKDEISINGTVYVRKDKLPKLPDKVVCKVTAVKPTYTMLGSMLELQVTSLSEVAFDMPYNSKIIRPGQVYTIFKGEVK